MKTQIKLTVLTLCAALPLVALVKPAKAEPQRLSNAAAVVLFATEGSDPSSIIVYRISCGGRNCPKVQLYTEVGEALALYLENGFELDNISPGLAYTLIRKPR